MPSEKCANCSKVISPAEAVRCCMCKQIKHKSCVALSTKAKVSAAWKCPECKTGKMKDSKNQSPVRCCSSQVASSEHTSDSSTPSISPVQSTPKDDRNAEQDVTNKDIMQEIRSLCVVFSNFQKEISDLKIEVRSCLTRMDGLEFRIDALEKCTSTQNIVPEGIDKIITELKSDLNDRDQDLLGNDLEIINLPEEEGEKPTKLILNIASKLGVSIEDRDIVSAERVGSRLQKASNAEGPVEKRPRALVVRLARRDVREELLQKARARRTVITKQLVVGEKPQRMFVNERLTKINKKLFRLARDAARQYGWQYVWIRRGRILARRKSGDPAIRIRIEQDVSTNIGPIRDTF